MIGCIILSAFLAVMAVKFLAHRRCGAGAHWGWSGYGPGPWHGYGPGPRGDRGGHGGRRWMWMLLSRLDLSPAQEKVVRAEFETLKSKAESLREEGSQSRADMARAIRGEDFDEEALAGMFVRHDDRMRELREDVGRGLGRIHTVLDPAQRERLADLIERGPFRAAWGGAWGGPYRSHHEV